uniref:Uncharacterized protein n=1 Tax=Coccolithus braarudii TaxID=221442 RepID=A0A7S0PXS7_9EUKA
MRSTIVSLASDDFPFLAWSRYLWVASERVTGAVRASSLTPGVVRVLTHPISVAVGKAIITQALYETTSNAAYLSMQAGLRGRGWRGVMAELRGKFWTVWRDGLIFWSGCFVVVFAMPIWWLQPIMDNLFTLFFNTYLAMMAYRPIPTAIP